MPIRTTLRRLWGFVRPPLAPQPLAAAPAAPSRPDPTPRESPPTDRALTRGAVRLSVWTAGPYVVVATSLVEARKVFASLQEDADPAARAAAHRMVGDERAPARRAAATV